MVNPEKEMQLDYGLSIYTCNKGYSRHAVFRKDLWLTARIALNKLISPWIGRESTCSQGRASVTPRVISHTSLNALEAGTSS